MQANPKSLIILGNGFDLFHGLPTSYKDFRDYVLVNRPDVADSFVRFIADGNYSESIELWDDFEGALALIRFKEAITDAYEFWGQGDPDMSLATYLLENVVDDLSYALPALFGDWISEIDGLIEEEARRITLPLGARYLNFNFTRSLQRLYGISDRNILHIHGMAETPSTILIGHGEFAPDSNEGWVEFVDDNGDSVDPWSEEINSFDDGGFSDVINYYLESTRKPVFDTIGANRDWLKSCRLCDEIYVLGHSLSDVDLPYFEFVINKAPSSDQMVHFSYYSNDDYERITEVIRRLRLPAHRVGKIDKIEGLF